jgi:hypothetical protein
VRDSYGKLAGWDLPRDHFVIEEIPEVKYPRSYQVTPVIGHSDSQDSAEARTCNTMKFSDFTMLLGRIIKQQFSHNFKILTNTYFTGNIV